jgi:hypothetical protein
MKVNIMKVDELDDGEETKASDTKLNPCTEHNHLNVINTPPVITKQSFIGSDHSPSSSMINLSLSNSVLAP